MTLSKLCTFIHNLACMHRFTDGYTTDDIIIRWGNKLVEFSPSLTGKHGLPQFRISGNTTGDCTSMYATGRVVAVRLCV